MSFDCVTPTTPLIARGIIPVLDSLQLCVSCNHRFLLSIHLVLQCLWLRTETPLISNMIPCDRLPVNSTVEDMVDTKRQILGRVRLVFEKHQRVFSDLFYLLNPRTERLDLGRAVGCFCTANSAFAFEQRYSERSERIVCACDKDCIIREQHGGWAGANKFWGPARSLLSLSPQCGLQVGSYFVETGQRIP